MIESSMYFAMGLLLGALIGLVLVPLVHGRAVRLTTRRLMQAILPETMAEVQAEKDLLRAAFAMSTRRLEIAVEELTNKTATQGAELSRSAALIKRLNVERDSQEIEIIALKTQVDNLKEHPGPPHKSDPKETRERLINNQPTAMDSLREPELNRPAPRSLSATRRGSL
jgi:hypothetical protein